MISCPKLILYKISQLLHPFHSLEESIRIFNILSSVAGESEYRYQKNCNRKCKSKTQFWTDCRSNKYFTNDEMTKKKKKKRFNKGLLLSNKFRIWTLVRYLHTKWKCILHGGNEQTFAENHFQKIISLLSCTAIFVTTDCFKRATWGPKPGYVGLVIFGQ